MYRVFNRLDRGPFTKNDPHTPTPDSDLWLHHSHTKKGLVSSNSTGHPSDIPVEVEEVEGGEKDSTSRRVYPQDLRRTGDVILDL